MKIYNTMTRKKEEFSPLNEGVIKMYVCGPTVYNYFHIGNGRTFLFFDVVRKYFEYLGYSVEFVQNITDIDDKIIDQSIKEGISIEEVTAKYIKAFKDDIQQLGLDLPTHQPLATKYIGKMIKIIKDLVDSGHAYEANGDVYFAVDSYKDYGKLSGKRLDDLKTGARVEENTQKKNPADFTLWKSSKPGEPKWKSPWGEGRPGWHTECVVMSRDLLGETFDIHGGAIDLIFPHHENEIAQAGASSGSGLAKVWMHGGFLNMSGEKMSKSLNNFFTTRDILKKYDGEVLRFFCLSKHYRSTIEYSVELLEEAKKAIANFYDAFSYVDYLSFKDQEINYNDLTNSKIDFFKEAMADDFNTAKALSVLFELARGIKNEAEYSFEQRKEFAFALVELGGSLGFFRAIKEKLTAGTGELTGKVLELLINYRADFKKEKNWKWADRIRNDLNELSVELVDKKDGTIWKLKK